MKSLIILLISVSVLLLNSCSSLPSLTQQNRDTWYSLSDTAYATDALDNTMYASYATDCYIVIAKGNSSDMMDANKIALSKSEALAVKAAGRIVASVTTIPLDEVYFEEANGNYSYYVKVKVCILNE